MYSRIILEFKLYFPVFRILGLCLLQNELCPITLNRHVIKVLLGRKVSDFDEQNPFTYDICLLLSFEVFHGDVHVKIMW